MAGKTKEEVIEAIRSVSKSIGNKPLSRQKFSQNSGITISNVLRYFHWSEACRLAGVEYDKSHERIPDEELLTDWGLLTRKIGHVSSLTEYKIKGKYSRNAFKRFGPWVDMPDSDAFRNFFAGSDEWKDVLTILEHSREPKVRKTVLEPKTIHKKSGPRRWHEKLKDLPTYGARTAFRAMNHAPINENGVIFLFGMVAQDLGYEVEAIYKDITPDCVAKRRTRDGRLQQVTIEFELESKNFVEHGHKPADCKVIVCWKHNWRECPKEIEIVELSEEIKTLSKEYTPPSQ